MNLAIPAQHAHAPASLASQVVVIEDDPVVRRFLRLCLYRAGLDVISFPTGDEAVEFLDGRHHSVGLIITDGIMPGMDGFAVARWCQEQLPHIRLVLLSGYLNHFIAQSDIPENIEAFFAKPFSADELVAKVVDLAGAVV